MGIPQAVRIEASKELARRYFLDYCRLRYPKVYTPDRLFLNDLANRLQAFVEQNDKRFMLVNIPPRHYKSFTGSNFVEWLFGRNPTRKVMTGTYNETLSTTFARKVATIGGWRYDDVGPAAGWGRRHRPGCPTGHRGCWARPAIAAGALRRRPPEACGHLNL